MDSEESLFDLNNITYCGEGNSTIVVSNSSLGWIIRIRKCDEAKSHSTKDLSNLAELSTDLRIPQYFGSRFTRQMLLINVNPTFLLKLEKKVAPMRPEYRLNKGIDLSERYVIVAPDASKTPPSLAMYTYGPTISVEIKPKFGAFLLWPATDVSNVVRTHASLFCLRQNHSGKLSRWKFPSEYCPCDLFSGDRKRMLRSLQALLRTPQINLRIHLDGQIIFSYEDDRLNKGLANFFASNPITNGNANGTCAQYQRNNQEKNKRNRCFLDCPFGQDDRARLLDGLLLDALLHELDPDNRSPARYSLYAGDMACFSCDCQGHPDRRLPDNGHSADTNPAAAAADLQNSVITHKDERDAPLPPEGSILGRVLATQLLSRLDICFIVPHYERVRQYLLEHDFTWENYARMTDEERSTLNLNEEIAESFDIVEKYLISLVARDCSIMITLQRAKPNCPAWVPTVGGTCPCLPRMVMNPAIIDLDPKHLDKIRDRLRVEQSIAQQTLKRHPDFLDFLNLSRAS